MRFSLRELLLLMLFAALLCGAAGQTWFKASETVAWTRAWPALIGILIPILMNFFVSAPQRRKIGVRLFGYPNRSTFRRWAIFGSMLIQPIVIGFVSAALGKPFAFALAALILFNAVITDLFAGEVVFGDQGVFGYTFAPWDVQFIKLNRTPRGDVIVFHNTSSFPVPDEYRERVRAIFQEKLGGF
jgi:hypothetical protein